MYESRSKSAVMIILLFLMALYFIGINFLDEVNKKNENNSYVSLNVISMTKEEYIEEYISYIKNEKFNLAYKMLSDESQNKFSNSLEKFTAYCNSHYKNISKDMWDFKYTLLSETAFKKNNVYEYKVLDKEKGDEVVINKIKLNEYASSVYKIDVY